MCTVLLINDSREILRAISHALDGAGIQCTTVSNPAEGVLRCFTEGPTVVITDLKLRLTEGTPLVEAIRRGSDVPILVLAGHPDEYSEAARLLGDIGVLRTPIDSIALLRNVRARCSSSWQLRASVNGAVHVRHLAHRTG